MKKICVSFLVVFSLFSTIVYAGNLVKKVYFSPYPILINGESYSSEMPILQYQERTYVALREFSEMVDVTVDFVDDVIIIDSENKDKENKNEVEIIEINDFSENKNDSTTNVNAKTVYISKSGKKYHKISNCNNANYYEITLSEAIAEGYTPCLRCASIN